MMRIRLPAIGLALLISGNAWADLRTYDVDFQYRQEVFNALSRVLIQVPADTGLGTGTYGRVQLLPSGQILVDASPETLEQVEQVLQAIRERPADAAPRVSLRYWAVLGTPPGGNAPDAPGTPVPSVLDGVLAEVERFHGELAFRVIGTAAAVTESGQEGGVEGMTLTVRQTAYAQGDTLNADINMRLQGDVPNFLGRANIGGLEVRTTLRRGEFVVLGEGALQGGGLDGPILYIVHWPEGE